MKKDNKIIVGIIALAAVIAVLFTVYRIFGEKTVEGRKNIEVEVVLTDGSSAVHEYQTEYEFLGEVLIEEKLVDGEVGAYGLFITEVDGLKADDTKQQWWCITKGGEQVNTSLETTPIADGEKYELTLKEGY